MLLFYFHVEIQHMNLEGVVSPGTTLIFKRKISKCSPLREIQQNHSVPELMLGLVVKTGPALLHLWASVLHLQNLVLLITSHWSFIYLFIYLCKYIYIYIYLCEYTILYRIICIYLHFKLFPSWCAKHARNSLGNSTYRLTRNQTMLGANIEHKRHPFLKCHKFLSEPNSVFGTALGTGPQRVVELNGWTLYDWKPGPWQDPIRLPFTDRGTVDASSSKFAFLGTEGRMWPFDWAI